MHTKVEVRVAHFLGCARLMTLGLVVWKGIYSKNMEKLLVFNVFAVHGGRGCGDDMCRPREKFGLHIVWDACV